MINNMNTKTTITAAFIAITATTATAEDICSDMGDLAQVVMENRQMGIAMSQMMKAVEGNDLAQALILSAYEEPRYSTDRNVERTVQDFRNMAEAMCYGME